MKNGELNTTLINSYVKLFMSLSVRSKQQLVERLTKSIKKEKEDTSETFFATFGAFQSNQSADDIISDLKANRNFNRNTSEL